MSKEYRQMMMFNSSLTKIKTGHLSYVIKEKDKDSTPQKSTNEVQQGSEKTCPAKTSPTRDCANATSS